MTKKQTLDKIIDYLAVQAVHLKYPEVVYLKEKDFKCLKMDEVYGPICKVKIKKSEKMGVLNEHVQMS